MPQAMRMPVKEPGPCPKPKRVHARAALRRERSSSAPDHRHQQLGMAVLGQRLLDEELVAAQQGDGAQLGGGFDGEEVHRRRVRGLRAIMR